MKTNHPYRKPEVAWSVTEKGIELKYPIFHHDPSLPDQPIIKKSIKEVLGDVDFWAWKGNEEDRIVDSTGKVFIAKFEETKRKTLLIIPTIIRSGLFPGELERIMEISEVKEIMILGIINDETRIKENIDQLKLKINLMNSIEEILETCSQYF